MSMQPLFSIITVSLNNRSGLEKTAHSLAGQSLQDFEWIVIDGGSEDGSTEWLTETTAQWVSEPDQGIYDAMNKGIERAGGMFLLFLNAGDTLTDPKTLQELAIYIGERDLVPDFVYGDSYEALQNGQRVHKPAKPYAKFKQGMFTHHQAMFYRREALGDLRYNQSYEIAADYDLTCRFLKQAQHVLYYPQPLCVFESGGISQQQVTQGRKEQFQIRKSLRLVSPPVNILFYGLQSMLWHIRAMAPSLYWSLKSSGNNGSASAQT